MQKFNIYKSNELVATSIGGIIKKLSDSAPTLLFHFGRSTEIPMWDFMHWAKTTRLIDENRIDLAELLKRYGLEKYDVVDLLRVTGGRKIQDDYWVEVLED